jgi:gliding motility-associated-like protein
MRDDGLLEGNCSIRPIHFHCRIADTRLPCGSVTDTVNLTFENCSCTFYIPDAFTPNYDGINDMFTPKPICNLDAMVSGYQLRIFNRWGQQVFNSRQVNAGWDGRFRGVMQAGGGYPWEMQYLDRLGRTVKRSGTVILIR